MHNKNTLFNNVFIRREFKSILGQKKRNFWILFFVFLCTLFSLEISRSGIKYLNYKMSDPFINWIALYPIHAETLQTSLIVNVAKPVAIVERRNHRHGIASSG